MSSTLFSQSIGYTDLGVLFSQENYNGTARYNAMSGAFGALGGEVSAIYQNPAGAAVFAKSEIALSYSYSNANTDATYYGDTSYNTNTSQRVPQFGGVIVFKSPYSSSNWSKFSLGINYNMLNDFRGNYSVVGNNGTYARYNLHPLDMDAIPYNNPMEQYFENYTDGLSEVFTLSFASAYKNFFYLGSSINFHTIEFSQETYLNEVNSDENAHILNAEYTQQLTENSTGISLGIGMILKPFRNFRLGLAYQSPVWHPEVMEESNAIDYDTDNSYTGFEEQGFLDIDSSAEGFYQNTRSNYPAILAYEYSLNTPEKWTASAAITLGQHGLISVDYHQKNYGLIRYRNSFDLQEVNNEIDDILTTARGVRAGAELRFNQISIRGGAFLEESPYKIDKETFYKKGASAGLGLKFKHTKLDFAYQYTKIDDQYSIYASAEPVENISLSNTISRITTTFTISF